MVAEKTAKNFRGYFFCTLYMPDHGWMSNHDQTCMCHWTHERQYCSHYCTVFTVCFHH